MKKAIAILLFIFSTLLLQSCGNKGPLVRGITPEMQIVQSNIDDGVKVAFVVPLSGKNASVGRGLLDAAQMALHNNKIQGVTLYPIDSQSRSSVNSIKDKGINVVVGPLFSDDTMMVYNMLRSHNVPVFSFSNDSSFAGKEGLYLLGISIVDQINSVLSFAQSHGYNRVFSVTPQNRYGDMVKLAVRNYGNGMQLVSNYDYSERDNVVGFNSIVANIYSHKQKEAQQKYAVVFPAADSKLIEFAKALELSSEDARESTIALLGSIQWDEPRVYRNYSSLLSGSYFSAMGHGELIRFQEKFAKSFGYQPSPIAALGYDAMLMMQKIVSELHAQGKNYFDHSIVIDQTFPSTITGIQSVNTDGTVSRSLTVRRVD